MTLLRAFCVQPDPVVRTNAVFWLKRSFTPMLISPRRLRKSFLPIEALHSR